MFMSGYLVQFIVTCVMAYVPTIAKFDMGKIV